MKRRYVLAPETAIDLAKIWRYIKGQSGNEMADRVEAAIRQQIVFLVANPGTGHWRKDLTDEPVKFSLVYTYHGRSNAAQAGTRSTSKPEVELLP